MYVFVEVGVFNLLFLVVIDFGVTHALRIGCDGHTFFFVEFHVLFWFLPWYAMLHLSFLILTMLGQNDVLTGLN
jgi:hypothetical protein